MEEYRMDTTRIKDCRKHKIWKYLGIILATLLGSFLAFYFAVSCTMHHFINRAYAIKEMHKMEKMAMNDLNKFDNEVKNPSKFNGMFQHNNAIDFIKTPDSYKFVVDLIPFQGNQNAISVEINGNEISINGENSINKNNTETFTKISQTYLLGKNAKTEKISKKKVNNKYIITVPIED